MRMNHSRSSVAILVAMQWANEDVFISSLVMLHSGEGGKRVGRDMYVEKESGTVRSTVGEERGGRCRAQNDR